MWDGEVKKFVPVPTDRELTARESKLTKFSEGELVYVKGMSFTIVEIREADLIIAPVIPK